MYFMLNLSARQSSVIYSREARGSGTAQLGLRPDMGQLVGMWWIAVAGPV